MSAANSRAITGQWREKTPEQQRAHIQQMVSGRWFGRSRKYLLRWISSGYSTEEQRRELALLLLRADGQSSDPGRA